MGVRTGAGKLGFRLAETWLFSRRSIASFTTSTGNVGNKKSVDLFICFDERRLSSSNKLRKSTVLRPIRLDSYDDAKEVELLEATNHRSPLVYVSKSDRNDDDEKEKLRRELACQTKVIRLGSEILFTVGQTTPRDICWVDPLTRPLDYHVSSQTETKIKSFSTTKLDMRWGVIDDKLYCFDNCSLSQPFEVLDPKIDQASWQPLIGPPFIRDNGGTDKYSVIFLNESKKILGWEDARYGVFCFDATKPENGWIESPRGFGDPISFIGQKSMHVVIHENHPKLGDFNLMFSYDHCDDPFIIPAFFISDNCDSFESIRKPICLPKELCSKYRLAYSDGYEEYITFGSQFVHLGSNKFCLILHKFDVDDDCSDCRTRGYILVLTFEYDVMVTNETNDSGAPLEIKTRMLGTRRFQYYKKSGTEKNDMIGAFSF